MDIRSIATSRWEINELYCESEPIVLKMRISLLTGGMDAHYAFGLLSGLLLDPIVIDVIGNDEMKDSDVIANERVVYYNLRGDQTPNVPMLKKGIRVLKYYLRLLKYAAQTDSSVFHILWLNKFTYFDRTLLNMYYKVLGKKLVYTAHNVNAGERDGNNSWLNRLSLRFLYKIVDHIFVHTEKMKEQLMGEFHINEQKVTVIPYGINNVVPRTDVTRVEVREKLSLKSDEKIILFFGNIAPYKGLDTLIMSLTQLKKKGALPRLLIAGRVKDGRWSAYWRSIERAIEDHNLSGDILRKVEYIPDDEVELYFKAADVLILPYRYIFQSGVLFLAYSFGLPVIAADVGSLKEEIIEGETGLICQPESPEDLANKIIQYFDSDLYKYSEFSREKIIAYANEQYSWKRIGETTRHVYNVLQ